MNKLLWIFLLIPSICFADSKISQLSQDTSPTSADIFPIVKQADGNNYKVALSDLKTYINTGLMAYSSITQDSNGNIGINTTLPLSNLTVKQTGTTDPFHVVSSASTSLFKVINGGNVGIGSALPGQTLDVQGTIRTIGLIAQNGNIAINTSAPNAQIEVINNGNPLFYGTSALGAVSGNLFSVTSLGALGIGTANPLGENAQYFLHVRHDTNSGQFIQNENLSGGTGSSVGLNLQTATSQGSLITYIPAWSISAAWAGRTVLNNLTGSGLALTTQGGGDIQFMNSVTTQMTFTNGGNMGIGKTPGVMLDVQGTIRGGAFYSSDGSPGVTSSTCTAWKNGLCTTP